MSITPSLTIRVQGLLNHVSRENSSDSHCQLDYLQKSKRNIYLLDSNNALYR